jgi:hypothetical protein
MNINSLLGIKLHVVEQIKGEAMEKTTGEKLQFRGRKEFTNPNLGRCLTWATLDGSRVFVEQCDTANRYEIRLKKRGKGYTADRIR